MNNKNNQTSIFTENRIVFYAILAIATSVLSLYSKTISFDFIGLDDPHYIQNNIHIQRGFNFIDLKWAFTTFYVANWHPLTWLSHTLDYTLFGPAPGMHHIFSVLMHLLNSIFLFFIAKKITNDNILASFITSLLFAIHPTHVESVAWISERKDVLSTFFAFLSLYSYLFYATSSSIKAYSLSLIFFILGLLTKPMIVTLPLIFILLDIWPLKKIRMKQIFYQPYDLSLLKTQLDKAPFVLLSIVSSCITLQAHKANRAITSLPITESLSNAAISYNKYFLKTFVPMYLAPLYPYQEQPLLLGAICLTIIIWLTLIFYNLKENNPYLLFGWAWFIITLLPVIGIIHIGFASHADRYTYFPSIGIFLAGSLYISKLWKGTNRHKISLIALSAIIAPAYFIQTNQYISKWENSETLFLHAIKVTKNNFIAHDILSSYYFRNNNYPESLIHAYNAINIKDDSFRSYNNIGAFYSMHNKIPEAMHYLSKAVQLRPDDHLSRMNLALAFYRDGDLAQALSNYLFAADLAPDTPSLNYKIGYLYEKLGDFKNSIKYYEKEIAINPSMPDTYFRLGEIYLDKDENFNLSIHYLKQAALKAPNPAKAYSRLGVAYMKLGIIDEARHQLTLAIGLDPDDSEAKQLLNLLSKNTNH